jgi:hypothetical protein
MIQANELRIGNYVYDVGGQPSKVVRLTEEKIPLASPIPLTPEILEKAGFIQHHDDCYLQPIYIKKIFGNPPFVWGVYPEVLGSGIVINDAMQLHYVHQLQNLYFALTGEELPIEL